MDTIDKQKRLQGIDVEIKEKETQLTNLRNEVKSRQKLLESLDKIVKIV